MLGTASGHEGQERAAGAEEPPTPIVLAMPGEQGGSGWVMSLASEQTDRQGQMDQASWYHRIRCHQQLPTALY